MLHKTRTHEIRDVAILDELARMLTNYVFTLETGFRCGKLTLLNDSFSEDGAQEYSVEVDGTPVESLTVSMTENLELLRILRALEEQS